MGTFHAVSTNGINTFANDILSVQLINATLGSYLQILLKHITDMLPGLKSRINAQLVAVAKEHAAYGDTAESTVIAYRYLHKHTLLIVAL
jgi:hypothetical protein